MRPICIGLTGHVNKGQPISRQLDVGDARNIVACILDVIAQRSAIVGALFAGKFGRRDIVGIAPVAASTQWTKPPGFRPWTPM